MSKISSDIVKKASEAFNSMADDDKAKVVLAYSLAQHTTIVQIRAQNKGAWAAQDAKLRAWQKNIERTLEERLETLTKQTTTNRNGGNDE